MEMKEIRNTNFSYQENINVGLKKSEAQEGVGKVEDKYLKGKYILPENSGEIKKLIMTFSTLWGKREEEYYNAIKSFVKNIPGKVYIVVNKLDYDKLKEDLKKQIDENLLNKIVLIQSDIDPSIWARDSIQVFVNYNKKNEEITISKPDRKWYPSFYDRYVYKEIQKYISNEEEANKENVRAEELEKLALDGGNTIATKNYIFVGVDAVKYSEKKGLPREKFIEFFTNNFPNQKLVIIGENKQPVFHIDMFLSILNDEGEKVALLGDPMMTVRFLSDPNLKYDTNKYTENHIKAMIDEAMMLAEENKEELEKIEQKLKEEGFRVVKVPIMIPSRHNLPYITYNLPYITYNNMLLSGNKAFVTQFGIENMDNYIIDVMKKEGFEPIPLDFTNISKLAGAIHCITNVIDRYDNELVNS